MRSLLAVPAAVVPHVGTRRSWHADWAGTLDELLVACRAVAS